MNPTIALLLSALTDAADERLTRAASLGRSHVDVEQDMLAATGLPVALVQSVVRLAAVRHVRSSRRCMGAMAQRVQWGRRRGRQKKTTRCT
jgi:hypothetical protein